MVIKIFSYQNNDLSRNLIPICNIECFIHMINNFFYMRFAGKINLEIMIYPILSKYRENRIFS